ncbi:hypothetical protein AOL_s00110g192 [Orbilia oligospora ATCC 24927]|uniref:Uncharacterized protein n=1 Tax=Arthrobotrys oligospora (strain ATCC 24927 / CBS 115.81 / DSM 1491) TaxID=756982 RepID=G1XL22_ARTOA|nr:hypothetical protein AOL_s00110g192 [Orbilia oligospora ATCC 24927]EGX46028.1 hypothetical protein AOL_s00110g192 [Orbilia oligospora ATCC 24927]
MDQRMDFVEAKLLELNKSVVKIDVQLWYLNVAVGGICVGGLMLLGFCIKDSDSKRSKNT